ncbi:MAG: 4'-phosphopantetheinyl transferase superfamily protein [Anaerovoracaceae bacterium]
MYLFFYEGYNSTNKSNEYKEGLIYSAVQKYIDETNLILKDSYDFTIDRTVEGKPYFRNAPICFSVSHSKELFVCAVSNDLIGVDIEEKIIRDSEKTAARYFGKNETHYVELWGSDGFMELWVRKEALTKLLGIPLLKTISKYELADRNGIIDEIIADGKEIYFTQIEIGLDIKCAVASCERGDVCIRSII